ncbi:MAG: UbiA family prenyltransferase [Candidatus Krumholzibacteriales bacterium]
MEKTRRSAADYLFLLRPMILIPVWSFFLLGGYHSAVGPEREINTPGIIAGFISFTLLIGAVYIINQITDRESDRRNDKLFLLPRGIITIRAAVMEMVALIAISFAIGIILMPAAFNIILILSLLLGAAYSIEPVRLKRRGLLDIAANGAGIGFLAPLAGCISAGSDISNPQALLPYPLAVASVHLVTTLADMEGDRGCGLRTSGVLLGRHWSVITSVLLMLSALLAAFLTENSIAFYAVLFSLPFYLVLAGKDKHSAGRVLLPAKTATLIFAVAAGYAFRLYLPFLAVVILLTRLYYRRRFGISYPSFR